MKDIGVDYSTEMNTGAPTATPLRGKVALVTGGSRGIGLAVAKALVAGGASVVLTGRDRNDLDRAQAELGAAALGVAADARDAEAVDSALRQAVDRFGGIDVLVNNAGVGLFRNVADMSIAEWQATIDTNLTGVFYYCHAAIPHLRARGGGWIVNISSLAGKNPFSGGAAYCASKAGLNAFSEALMQEVRYDNIRVTYVMPGSVATGFGGRGGGDRPDWKIQPEDVGQVIVDLLLMPARSLPSRIELRPSKPPQK
jgi:NAD(P)-dependent dehydrogenase (short-subunit alcohol dehydrogenase family)